MPVSSGISRSNDALEVALQLRPPRMLREQPQPWQSQKVSLLSHRYGARKCRYIGRRKAELQAAWTAALVNLTPISHKLAAKTR
jgi:hypothetical protein